MLVPTSEQDACAWTITECPFTNNLYDVTFHIATRTMLYVFLEQRTCPSQLFSFKSRFCRINKPQIVLTSSWPSMRRNATTRTQRLPCLDSNFPGQSVNTWYSRQVAQENGREKLMTRCKEVTAMMGPDLTDPKNRTRKMKSSTLVTKYSGPSTFLPTVTGSSHHSSSLLTPGTSGFPPLSSDESVRHRKHHKKSGKRAQKSSSNSKRRRASPKGLANTGNSLPKLAVSNSAGGVSYPHTDSKVFKVDRLQPLHTTTTGASVHRTIRGDKKSPHKRRKSSKTST
ncbi:uncharacterized protein LOC118413092 isoform X2 [Branchiostoma floridae]|uniref:Uncharacterized protein LOC118413092 isoform X2 n=1 Tax=Branchiostoma floridae TaxID=7739 RepID=A0A9J7KX44_BRAFL|nr:uncharacterized protein LOC118413092 isoform X2 [Branchiostoma floridae]